MRYCLYTLALAALILSCAGAYLQLAGLPTATSVRGATIRSTSTAIHQADEPTDRNDLGLIRDAGHFDAPGLLQNIGSFVRRGDELLCLDTTRNECILAGPGPRITLARDIPRPSVRLRDDSIAPRFFQPAFGGPVPPTLRIDPAPAGDTLVDSLAPYHDRLHLVGMSGVAIGSSRPMNTTSRDALVDGLPFKDFDFGQHPED